MAAENVERTNRKNFIASQIRQARQRLGVSQQELARRVGLPAAQSVSDIENGERDVKATELGDIAEALHLDARDLLRGIPPSPQVLWRDGPEEDSVRIDAEAYLWRKCRYYRRAEEWMDLARSPELPTLHRPRTTKDFSDLVELADTLRGALGLGSYPSLTLVKALEEKLGVKVLYEKDLPGSALCLRDSDLAVIVINASQVPWRRNYSVAHELFHLLTWDLLGPDELRSKPEKWSSAERQADIFASVLLLPADSLLGRLASRGWDKVSDRLHMLDLAREFDVSTEALVWRLVDLHRLSRSQADKLLADPDFRTMDRALGRTASLVDTFTSRFFQLLLLAHAKGKVSTVRIAEMTGVSLREVRQHLADLHAVNA